MKKLRIGFVVLLLVTAFLSIACRADATKKQAQAALKNYLAKTDMEQVLVVKDDDSPCELKLPSNLTAGLSQLEIYETLYDSVGIDLKAEVRKGNLYLKNSMYYIKFKEKKIEKIVIKDLKDDYKLAVKEVSLKDIIKIWGINLKKQQLKTLDDLKYLLGLKLVYLGQNPGITNYFNVMYWKNLRGLGLENNNLKDINFLNNITNKLGSLDLSFNKIDNIEVLHKFTNIYLVILSHNQISSLKGLENNEEKIDCLYIDYNPMTIKGLSCIEKLCYDEKIYKLKIDRKVFKDFKYQSEYPKYLQWVNYLYYVEANGKITEEHVEEY